MSFSFHFNLPTKIIFGTQTFQTKLAEEAQKLGKKTVVVTGKSHVIKSGLLKKTGEILRNKGIKHAAFSEVEPNPSTVTVHKGADFTKNFGADFLVAIGGGSALDAAKAVGILYSSSSPFSPYY